MTFPRRAGAAVVAILFWIRRRPGLFLASVAVFVGLFRLLFWEPEVDGLRLELAGLRYSDTLQVYSAHERKEFRAFHESRTDREFVQATEEPLAIDFRLPRGDDLREVRLDFAKRLNQVAIGGVVVGYFFLGEFCPLGRLSPAEILERWIPNGQIVSASLENGSLVLETDGTDPYAALPLDRALWSSPVPSAELWTFRSVLFGFHILLAAGILLVSSLIRSHWLAVVGTEETPVWNRLCPLAFAVIVSGVGAVVFWPFLSGDRLFLFADSATDSIDAFWPSFIHISDIIRSGGWPLWSFSVGVGTSIAGWVGDPFLLFIYFLPGGDVASGLGWMQFGKVVIAGALFFGWFRLLGLGCCSAAAGALGLGFSAQMIVRGAWLHYSSEVVMAGFFLLAIELFVRRRIWHLLPLAVMFLVVRGVYHTYLWSQIFFVYSVVRLWVEYGFRWKPVAGSAVKWLILYAIGLAMIAVVLVPNSVTIIQSPRVSGEESKIASFAGAGFFGINDPTQWLSAVYGLFAPDILGRDLNYTGWRHYLEGPHLYAGLLLLLLAPQALLRRSPRVTIALLFGIGLGVLYLFSSYFRFYLNAFSGEYFKTSSFWFSILLAGCGAAGLDNLVRRRIFSRWLFGLTLAIAGGVLFVGTRADWVRGFVEVGRNAEVLRIVTLLLPGYAIAVFLLARSPSRSLGMYLVLGLFVAEVASLSSGTLQDRNALRADGNTPGGLYFGSAFHAVAAIREIDPGFYRTEKNYTTVHFNDAQAQNYRGLRSYYSFNSQAYYRFLSPHGFDVDFHHRNFGSSYIAGFRGRYALETLLSVKYYLVDPASGPAPPGYERFGSTGRIEWYRNTHEVPFGPVYRRVVGEAAVAALKPREARDLVALRAAIVPPGTLADLGLPVVGSAELAEVASVAGSGLDSPEYLAAYAAAADALAGDTLEITRFSNNRIEGQYRIDEPGLAFLSIPAEHGWTFRVDGEPVDPVLLHFGFTGLPLAAGVHEVTCSYFPPGMRIGIAFSLLGGAAFLALAVASIASPRVRRWLAPPPLAA